MDIIKMFNKIIEDYNIFKIDNEKTSATNQTIYFSDDQRDFVMVFPKYEKDYDYNFNKHMPIITLINETNIHPHFMFDEVTINKEKYRFICLYQDNQYVFSSKTLFEKMEFLISRLNKLLTLNEKEKNEEYQKEFLYYWSNFSRKDRQIDYSSFIQKSDTVKYINIKEHRSNKYKLRLTDTRAYFNDSKEWKKKNDLAIYIPIINTKNILPPIKRDGWGKKELLFILNNFEEDKVSKKSLDVLGKILVKRKVFLLFSFDILNVNIQFMCKITFNSEKEKKLTEKINDEFIKLEHIGVTQMGFKYLCNSIGNNPHLIGKKVGIVGVGSLGSYLAEEIVNSGANDIVLYDADKLSNTNLFRHRLIHPNIGENKARILAKKIEKKHPEVKVNFFEENLDTKNICKQIENNNLDYLIITVGTTDIQKHLELLLKKCQHSLAIIFIWLEGNGKECYATFINNKSKVYIDWEIQDQEKNKKSNKLIHDVCGGTRMAYGNRALLNASNLLLFGFETLNERKLPFTIKANFETGISNSNYFKNLGEKDEKV